MTQNQLITTLTTVLVLVIVGSLVILFGLPTTAPTPEEVSQGSTETTSFNLDVLQRQPYQLLNKQPVQDNSLPVQPPANVGKANPFL